MLPEAGVESLSIIQHISGGSGGRGGDGYDHGHGGGGGRGEGPTLNYNITAGQFNMNTQDMEQSEREKIIDWLSPLNFFVRQDDIFITQQEGTGEWLLHEEQFKQWESSIGGVLWCHGIPGVGKTVLAYGISQNSEYLQFCPTRSLVVNHLTNKHKATSNFGVACIYLDHKQGSP
ncbi:hypothetical protein K438DRAFT_1823723 [Mycena galopus ATCC 62051]|nr:hypothetical protein K438DRAFT_1823723 [Mycena galopus ATCC 62051]